MKNRFLHFQLLMLSKGCIPKVSSLMMSFICSSDVADNEELSQAKEEQELPEYILGTVRLNRLKPDSALGF